MQPDRTLRGSSPSNSLAEGEVTRVDTAQRVIVLNNGQMYQVPADSVVYVNGQPTAWTTVQPGTRIVVSQGQLVELRDGRYMLVQSPGAVTTTPGVRQTIYGRVTDVDRNEIRVKTADESFEVKMRDPKSAGIRKGDNVQLDLTFTPGSPSASVPSPQSIEGLVESIGVAELKLQTSDGRAITVDTSGVDRQALRAIGPGDVVTVTGKGGATPDRFVAQSVEPRR